MIRKENEIFAKRVVQFYTQYAKCNSLATFNHFKAEGKAKSTIYGIISRYKQQGNADYKKITGRHPSVATTTNVIKIRRQIKNNPIMSVRKGAKKLGISKSSYSDIKVKKLKIKAFKRKTAPKYVKDQKIRAKKNCGKIVNVRAKKKILIIDDETYVPVDPQDVSSNLYYHTDNKETLNDDVIFKPKTKFPERYLVWQAIDEEGNVSQPYISTKTQTGETYLKNCLQKILLPFIEEHHDKKDILLWMDMASCHYSTQVTNWLHENKIDFIEKNENAPNVPIARPIERFWALCKNKYGNRNKPAKNLCSFKKIWSKISKDIAIKSGKNLMKNMRKNLSKISKFGVLAPLR
jgi:transposase